MRLPDGPYSTIAGLVLHQLGRIPEQPGDIVTVDGWQLEVIALEGKAISEVRLRPDPAGDDARANRRPRRALPHRQMPSGRGSAGGRARRRHAGQLSVWAHRLRAAVRSRARAEGTTGTGAPRISMNRDGPK